MKHVERTKIIAHVIDISGSEGRDPYEDYLVINKELQEFNPKLLEKPRIIIANKMDLPNAKENLDKLREEIGDIKIFEIEAISNKGLEEVINYLGEMTSEIEEQELFEDNNYETHVLYKFKEAIPP